MSDCDPASGSAAVPASGSAAVPASGSAAVPASGSAVDVDDPADPRLGDYVGLTDIALRRRLEPAGGLFIAEGEIVVRRALRAGYRPRSLLLGHRWGEIFADVSVTRFLASQRVLEATTGFHVHRGVLGSFERRPLPSVASIVAGSRRLAVLEQVNSSTNLGAIFRSAAALGMDGVLLDPQCCDPLYRRAVRVSMGEVFAIPYARVASWPGELDRLREHGFQLLALTPDPLAEPLHRLDAAGRGRIALLIGAEGPGLSAGALDAADRWVRIAMAGDVDSLNVAVAASLAFYELGTAAG